jgi:soluble lytic murein transglycosylase-like protein
MLTALLLATGPKPSFTAEVAAAVRDVARVYPVPPTLVEAVMKCESGFNPRALSRTGAIGLMQVMPFNAPLVGLKREDLWNPALNILAGTRLLAVLLRHYDGDLVSVLVAYNAGPRPRSAPIPQNGETPSYVRAVLRTYEAFEHSASPPPVERRRSVFAFGASLYRSPTLTGDHDGH